MKNKIGILENDIYIFPIVNSVILLSASLSKHVLHTGIYGTFFDPGFKVQLLPSRLQDLVLPIGVQKPGSQYSPAIYTMDIAYKIDIPLYIFDRYITGI